MRELVLRDQSLQRQQSMNQSNRDAHVTSLRVLTAEEIAMVSGGSATTPSTTSTTPLGGHSLGRGIMITNGGRNLNTNTGFRQ